MHHSRIGSIAIDCDNLTANLRFWSGALNLQPEHEPTADEQYVSLDVLPGGIRVLVERVTERKIAKTRLHPDIETNDLAAEVRRMEALGARIRRALGYDGWVMEERSGNEFCVIAPETPGFPDRANEWPSP